MSDEAIPPRAVQHSRPVRAWWPLAAFVVLALAVLPAPAQAASGPHIVRADGDCLRMRTTPGLSGTLITCLAEGTQVFALGESQDVDGIRWERISAGGLTGWAAGVYLVPGTASATPVPTAIATVAPTAPPATPASGTISGTVSSSGGYSIVLWTGGPVESLVSVAGSRGCGVRSVWVTSGGTLIAYIAGAPSFVNEAWHQQMGTGALPQLPVILVCTAGAVTAPPSATAPPTPPPAVTPVATPTPPPPSGNSPGALFPRGLPPGPAGNE